MIELIDDVYINPEDSKHFTFQSSSLNLCILGQLKPNFADMGVGSLSTKVLILLQCYHPLLFILTKNSLQDWTSGLAFHSNATSTNVIWLLGDKAIYDWLKYEKNLLRNHWRVGEVTKNSTLVFGLLWRKLKQSFILGFSTQPVCKNCPKKWLK